MKKLILIAGTFLCINVTTAQTNTATPGTMYNGTEVQTPGVVTNHFNVDYPNTNNATWYKDGSDYRAEYTDGNNMGRSVTYNKDGMRIGTEAQLSNSDYPSAIGDYYTKKYPNEDYQVWSSVDGAGNTTYYTNHKSETLWFDKSGKYTSKSKKKTYGKK